MPPRYLVTLLGLLASFYIVLKSHFCTIFLSSFVRCHLGLLHKRKRHFFFRKISYYSNSSASFQLDNLLLCGDIHPNPCYGSSAAHNNFTHVGRKPPMWKHPCGVCSNSVRSNQKRILCDGCCTWHHIKCINMDIRTYIDLGSSNET